MFFRIVFLLLGALLSMPSLASADDYADPTWQNLTRTLIRFNAVPLSDAPIIDEYSIITECDLYKAFYKDDFKWNQVREAVRKSVHDNAGTFPLKYHYDVRLQLDHYDFERKTFLLSDKTALRNVNAFVLFSVVGDNCGSATVKYLPRTFRAVLSSPLYLEGLPLGENDGRALLKEMEADHDSDRSIHARFNLSVVYIEPMHKNMNPSRFGDPVHYGQGHESGEHAVRLDVRLDSIDFYEDIYMAHLIYQYIPEGAN